MHPTITAQLESLVFGPPQTGGGLTIAPLFCEAPEVQGVLTLAAAIESGALTLREVPGQASVPELEAVNASDLSVLILEGEQVRGGWQDRAAAASVLLGPGSSARVPVSCVEQGRWGGGPASFDGSEDHLPSSHRAIRHAARTEAAASGDTHATGQGAVWSSISAAQAHAGVQSPTGALRDLYARLSARMSAVLGAFPCAARQCGFIAIRNGEPVHLEFLGSHEAYSRSHERLIRSLLADVLTETADEERGPGDGVDALVEQFLSDILSANHTIVPSVGLGQEHHIRNGAIGGSALIHAERMVHFVAFRTPPSHAPVPAKAAFPRSYWVAPDRLLAGCYPGDPDKGVAAEKLTGLLDAGVRSIVNLMEPDERGHGGQRFVPYEALCWKLAQERGAEMTFLRAPVRDMAVPTAERMARILDTIDGLMARGGAVYVHCWGGYGRTGTVIGCWLARHGHAEGEAALELLSWLRRNEATAHSPSPQTDEQRDMVRRWRRGW